MGAQNIVKVMKQYQESWVNHVERMDTNRLPKVATTCTEDGHRLPKVATTCTEDGHKHTTKTSTTI